MIRICDICKREFNDRDMKSYNYGRRAVWLCLECDAEAQRQVAQSEIYRNAKRKKIKNKMGGK